MNAMTPEFAELRRLAEAAQRNCAPDDAGYPSWYAPCEIGGVVHRTDAVFIVAANPATVLALLDAAAILDEVRGQVARGALCPMCSTGMTRQTVGMVCQLCGTDYARPEYASLRRDAEQTTKAALAEALAVRAERDALAAFAQGLQVATDSLRAERDALAAKVERVRALAERWRYAGPNPISAPTAMVLDGAAGAILAALDEEAQP